LPITFSNFRGSAQVGKRAPIFGPDQGEWAEPVRLSALALEGGAQPAVLTQLPNDLMQPLGQIRGKSNGFLIHKAVLTKLIDKY